jgi:protein-tyrosine-phosphatase
MQPITILFMCSHNAAKSVMAAAYCQQMTAEQRLGWRILTAGTEPDDEPSAAVVALLRSEGLAVAAQKPHRVTEAELAAADWIVSMGCDLTGLVPPGTAVVHWDDIPPPSQDLLGAKQAIINHLVAFVNQLNHVKR